MNQGLLVAHVTKKSTGESKDFPERKKLKTLDELIFTKNRRTATCVFTRGTPSHRRLETYSVLQPVEKFLQSASDSLSLNRHDF